ncbi:MAG: hypothetical protein RSD27_03320 [Ruthenibacterium sp.]
MPDAARPVAGIAKPPGKRRENKGARAAQSGASSGLKMPLMHTIKRMFQKRIFSRAPHRQPCFSWEGYNAVPASQQFAAMHSNSQQFAAMQQQFAAMQQTAHRGFIRAPVFVKMLACAQRCRLAHRAM